MWNILNAVLSCCYQSDVSYDVGDCWTPLCEKSWNHKRPLSDLLTIMIFKTRRFYMDGWIYMCVYIYIYTYIHIYICIYIHTQIITRGLELLRYSVICICTFQSSHFILRVFLNFRHVVFLRKMHNTLKSEMYLNC